MEEINIEEDLMQYAKSVGLTFEVRQLMGLFYLFNADGSFATFSPDPNQIAGYIWWSATIAYEVGQILSQKDENSA